MNAHTETAQKYLALRDAEGAMAAGDWANAPASIATAYEVQAAATTLKTDAGTRPIGYKIGATNAAARDLLGVSTPFYGRLFEATTMSSPASLTHRPGLHRVYEPEVAIEIAHDLDPAKAPFDASAIEAATCAVMPAIEVIACRFDPWMTAGPENLIADNGVHGWQIFGAPVSDWSDIDLLGGEVSFSVNGEVFATGAGSNVDGGAFGAASWLANKLAEQGKFLKAGDRITTGTTTAPCPIKGRETVIADFGALGRIELRMDAPA